MSLLKWLYPGMKLKRWFLVFAIGVLAVSLGLALIFNYKYLDFIEESIFRFVYNWNGSYDYMTSSLVGLGIILVGVGIMLFAIRGIVRSLIMALIPENSGKLVDVIYEKRKLQNGPNIVVIGGGHGLSVLLRGIKQMTSNVTAVVTVADDGGSSGRLREGLGIIPPGDLRNCLVALADTEPLMEKLFQYRFSGDNELSGHSFGNLFLAAMNEVTGDMETALKESSKVLAVAGHVLPASKELVRLDALMTDGSIVEGESKISEAHKTIAKVRLFPKNVPAVQSVLDAIKHADAIILGPGSLYTSVIPNLLVDGVAKEVRQSKAIKIYICNVMTQAGETDHYTASMHVKAIFKHAGKGTVDYVLANDKMPTIEMRKKYAEQGSEPVKIDVDVLRRMGVGILQADIMSEEDIGHHDPNKLINSIFKMMYEL